MTRCTILHMLIIQQNDYLGFFKRKNVPIILYKAGQEQFTNILLKFSYKLILAKKLYKLGTI